MNKKLKDDDYSSEILTKKKVARSRMNFYFDDEEIKKSGSGKRNKKNWIKEYQLGTINEYDDEY